MDKGIKERINDVVSGSLGVEGGAIDSDASLVDDLGADSLDSVELVMAIEDEFDVAISDEKCEAWKTVGDIYKYFNCGH